MSKPRYKLNVTGDFYVETSCCTLCGLPEAEAPDHFAADTEQCFIKKQPHTEDELKSVLAVLYMQEMGCIRYGGSDSDILKTILSWNDSLNVVDASQEDQNRAEQIGRVIDCGLKLTP